MLEISNFKKIFVVGCPRSGTTWLTKMLGKHPLIIMPPRETHVYTLIYEPFTYLSKMKLNKRLKRWEWILKYYGLLPILNGISEDDLWKGIINAYKLWNKKSNLGLSSLVEENELEKSINLVRNEPYDNLTRAKLLIDKMFSIFFEKNGGDSSSYFLEKTPMHIKYIDVILDFYSQAQIIEIVRDCRDVCASWQAFALKQRWARKNTNSIINIWNNSIERGKKCRSNPLFSDRIYQIKYEDLKNNTETELEKAFDFIQLNLDSSTLKSIVETFNINKIKQKGKGQLINKGVVGGWKTSLKETDIALCNKLAKVNLIELGYSLESN